MQARVLDRELLDAGEEDAVDPPLPLEVVAAVLEEPAEHRHHDASLEKQNQRCGAGTSMRLVMHRSVDAPGGRIAQQLRKDQRVGVRGVRGGLEKCLDLGKKRRILEGAGAAALEELRAQAFAD